MINNILFDFDGVIIDSIPIRTFGFKQIFKNFPEEAVDKLIEFHEQNTGLSRFVKIKYFYNEILNRELSDDMLNKHAQEFTWIMRRELPDKKYLISDTLRFIEHNFKKLNFHMLSSSEDRELKYLCSILNIDRYFKSIHGYPPSKSELIRQVMEENNYEYEKTILIGDSKNDMDAASENHITFYAFNNPELKIIGANYINDFSSVIF